MIQRIRNDSRIQLALVFGVTILLTAALIASRYGESGIETIDGERRVKTDGEHCALILPDGWSWRAASWTAVSPNGTILGFSEQVFGRPENPDWDEVSGAMVARSEERDDATVTADDDTVRVDYGPDGGLSVLQRFDRIGCLLTFSGAGSRIVEDNDWESIVASLERTSPTGTPEEDLPWKTD
ncbi:MAG: hypothetical protein R3A46_03825 [Thermomicrobiales bacterium]